MNSLNQSSSNQPPATSAVSENRIEQRTTELIRHQVQGSEGVRLFGDAVAHMVSTGENALAEFAGRCSELAKKEHALTASIADKESTINALDFEIAERRGTLARINEDIVSF
eukprot:GHVU01140933.1.p3 GENE.GHVU01140933.1~~GHVU01140933.1.p3  ORF type:complete len:112 (-),score=13.14 GHVU01140933.1:716-1051(-)